MRHGRIGHRGGHRGNALGDLRGIRADHGQIRATRHDFHSVRFDIHELVVLLKLHLVTAACLDGRKHAHLREQLEVLLSNEARQGIGGRGEVAQATALGFDMPFLRIAVAREQDALVRLQALANPIERGMFEFHVAARLHGIGEFLERFRHGGVEHGIRVGHIHA